MPRYDYCCTRCVNLFEVTQSINSENKAYCPSCKGEAKRVFSPPHVIYTGEGFYTTDSKKKSNV